MGGKTGESLFRMPDPTDTSPLASLPPDPPLDQNKLAEFQAVIFCVDL